jgi:hypothetical protein
VFEIPFQRYRSWAALKEAALSRRRPAPAAPPPAEAEAPPAPVAIASAEPDR